MRLIRQTTVFALGAALGIGGLAGPAAQAHDLVGATSPRAVAAVQAAPRASASTIAWKKCDFKAFDCASITVPRDWADPTGPTIFVDLARLKATKQPAKLGSLLINPGGPGASGIDLLAYAEWIFSPDILKNFDIIGFDPRGVKGSAQKTMGMSVPNAPKSSPVRCASSTAQMDKVAGAWYPTTVKGRKKAAKDLAALAKRCQNLTGDVLGHIDTVSTVRDMEAIRVALGEDKLNFFGFSYGTKLGAYYAELFGDKVGRLVLDGALDPSLSEEKSSMSQLRGFDTVLRIFAKDCAKRRCALGTTQKKVLTTIKKFYKKLKTKSIGTKLGKRLTVGWAYFGLVDALYTDASWPDLRSALKSAIKQNDGTKLMRLAYEYHERVGGKYQANMTVAFTAINCLDYGGKNLTLREAKRLRARAMKVSPTIGEFWFSNGINICAFWPHPQVDVPHAVSSTTKAPILIVGTTKDPATPYAEAKALTKQLKTARLLTYVGNVHTAYGGTSQCIDTAVDKYLLTGKPPAKGKRC